MYRILKLKQLDSGSGSTQINSSTLLQGPGLNVNITGDTISDALNYILEIASEQHVSKLTKADKQVTGCTTTNNSMITGFSITNKPSAETRIDLRLNGVVYNVGETILDPLYFSDDSGSTAIQFNNLNGGESLYWKYTDMGFNIETSDRLDLDYETNNIIYTDGATGGLEYLNYSFTGDNSTTSFNFSHNYGHLLPKTFTSYESISGGTLELFEFSEIKFTNNNIEILFAVVPNTNHVYNFTVGF